MRKEQVTLMMLASADGRGFTPAQIQKALFLLSKESPELFASGSRYEFKPYDYGPFDAEVYHDIDSYGRIGLAEVLPGRVRQYAATEKGIEEGKKLLNSISADERGYLQKVSNFVRGKSFSDLISSIYRAYPEMKENSIFVGK